MLKNKPTDQSDLKMLSTRPVVYWRDLFAVLICTRPAQGPAGGAAGDAGVRGEMRGAAESAGVRGGRRPLVPPLLVAGAAVPAAVRGEPGRTGAPGPAGCAPPAPGTGVR